MATKKTAGDKRAGNNGATAQQKPAGKPFERGNPYAFKPGQSGNPAGRPREAITPYLRDYVQRKYPGKSDATYAEMIAKALVDCAIRGEIAAIREVFDRLDGKPRQPVNLVDVNVDTDREAVERVILGVIEDHEARGETITREEAIVFLRGTRVGQDPRAMKYLT